MKPFQLKVEKPWGYELIYSSPDSPITGKIHHVNQGARCSYQYHDKKQEVLCLQKGKAKLIFEGQEIEMEPLKGYFIAPFQKHRFWGITDCEILEVSTKEEGNTVRLEDDYSRGTETEEARRTRAEGKVYMG